MAVRAEDRMLGPAGTLAHLAEQRPVFLRQRITDRIRQVDNRRAFLNRRLHQLDDEVHIRTCRIHGREFDAIGELLRIGHCFSRHLLHLGARFAQAMLKMDIR